MKLQLPIQLLFSFFYLGSSFFLVPEDIPQFMTIIYSLIPPIKVGVENTKIGYGFRIGRNADLQMMVELGPQYSTTPSTAGASKREILSKAKKLKRFEADNKGDFMAKLLGRRPAAAAPNSIIKRIEATNDNSKEPNVKENEI